MLTAKEIEVYRQKLRATIDRLEIERTRLEGELTPGGQEGGLSDSTLLQTDLNRQAIESELTLSLLANEEQLLNEANAALARIDQGSFGQCEACGHAIAKERLHALPYARYCAACAHKLEQKKSS